jgi:hypothetical protein
VAAISVAAILAVGISRWVVGMAAAISAAAAARTLRWAVAVGDMVAADTAVVVVATAVAATATEFAPLRKLLGAGFRVCTLVLRGS